MKILIRYKQACLAIFVLLLSACATQKNSFDYTAYKQHFPKSILVLPPLNNSPDIKATSSVLATTTAPLAEAGYYVFPVALVNQTFKDNGVLQPFDIHAVSHQKLHDIFGADAVLYMTVERYGAQYTVINSQVLVTLKGKLVDLKTGTTLWTGEASATNNDGNNNQGGLAGMLIGAIVKQVMSQALDVSHKIASDANARLLTPTSNGLLYGPRSPQYEKSAAK